MYRTVITAVIAATITAMAVVAVMKLLDAPINPVVIAVITSAVTAAAVTGSGRARAKPSDEYA